jgi:hypothetical protein
MMSHDVQIFLANARVDDPAAKSALLAPLQDGGATAKALVPGQTAFAYVYNIDSRTARYLVSDGEMISCFSLVGVTQDEGMAVAKACEDKTDWSLNSFQTTAGRALRGSFVKFN